MEHPWMEHRSMNGKGATDVMDLGSGRRMRRLTSELVELATQWRHPSEEESRTVAERAFVDTVACTCAAVHDPAVRAATTAFATTPEAYTPFPYGQNSDPRHVALIGGLTAHALDYDDVDSATISHPSAVLFPALLALSEHGASTGIELIEAYWSGLAAGRLLGAAIGITPHYNLGWHSTSTIGTIAAAAAASRLLALDHEQTRYALGIAGSLAAGSRQNFGTMTKPLHAGTAAANAVLAGRLAAAGFTADTEMLEGPLGFLALHQGQAESEAASESEAATDAAIELLGLNVKLYPCCYYLHSAADAMLDHAADGLHPATVQSIDVCVQPDGLSPLIHRRPVTGLQGKFSMEYAMAAALLDGQLTLVSFTDQAVSRPEAQRLIPLVTSSTSDVPPIGPQDWDGSFAVVTVTTTDGDRLVRRVDRPRGHASRPVNEEQLRAKFDDCLRFGGFDPTDEVYAGLRALREADSVRDSLRSLRSALFADQLAS